MKVIIAFAFLIAGISALPHLERTIPIDVKNERLVSDQVESAIEDAIGDACQAIREAGLDPFYIERENSSYELPVPVLFNYEAIAEDILNTGLSDIKTHSVSYSVITSRLNFDIEMPLIHFSAGAAKADAVFFSNELNLNAAGKIDVVSIRVVGQLRLNVGVISGITVRSIKIDFKLGDINSDLNLVILGRNYSEEINDFVGLIVPETIKAHYDEINELLEIVLLEVINANLQSF